MSASWERLEARLNEEDTPLGRLRSAPTGVRAALALGVAAATALCVLALMGRPDLGVFPAARLTAELSQIAALALVTGLLWLHPLHRPPISAWVRWGVVLVVVLVPIVLATADPAHQSHPASLGGVGEHLVPAAQMCWQFGMMLALPTFLALWAVGRGSGHANHVVLGFCAAGLAGYTAIFLHCPYTSPLHLFWGHATVVVAFALLGAALGWPLRRAMGGG